MPLQAPKACVCYVLLCFCVYICYKFVSYFIQTIKTTKQTYLTRGQKRKWHVGKCKIVSHGIMIHPLPLYFATNIVLFWYVYRYFYLTL